MLHIIVHPAAAGLTIDIYPAIGLAADLLILLAVRALVCALRAGRSRAPDRVPVRKTLAKGGRRPW